MIGLPFDCLANPLGAVRVTFEKAIESGLDPSSLSGKHWVAIDVFCQCLFDHEGLSQVPFLDSTSIHWIKPNTLVRFRGMVQDMLGNEFYVGAYKDGSIWRTNKFSDVASSPMGPLDRQWILVKIAYPISDRVFDSTMAEGFATMATLLLIQTRHWDSCFLLRDSSSLITLLHTRDQTGDPDESWMWQPLLSSIKHLLSAHCNWFCNYILRELNGEQTC